MARKTTRKSQPDGASILAEACERNTSLEMHRRARGGVKPVMRARMIRVDDSCLYVDQAQAVGRDTHIKEGDKVEAFFELRGSFFTFTTRVREARRQVRLNDTKVVPGMSLDRPTDVKAGQRRAFFRTRVIGVSPIPVLLHLAHNEDPSVCPLDAVRFPGMLVDASQGGFGINVDAKVCNGLERFERIFVYFVIPDTGEQIVLLCELRQVRAVHEGMTNRLGLMALPWPDNRHYNLMMHPLGRWLTQVERGARLSRGAA